MTKVLIKKDNNPFSVDNFNGVKIKGFDITFWDIEKLYFDFKTIDSSFLSNKSLTDLWKSGDKNYNDFLSNFLQIAKNFDIIYFNIYNPFPPEWVFINLKDKRTIFFCNDDPHKSYERTAGAVWAYDMVCYWSPTYDSNFTMKQILEKWGARSTKLLPLSLFSIDKKRKNFLFKSLNKRKLDSFYIGNYYQNKYYLLLFLKNKLKNKFFIGGNWPLKGYFGFFAFLLGRKPFNFRVRRLNNDEKINIHLKSKICINFHLNKNQEHGNLRTFESVYYGNLLISDRGILEKNNYFFEPNKEAIYYDNIEEVPSLVEYYLKNEEVRISIVKNSINKFIKNYNKEDILRDLFVDTMKLHKD